jgi:leader peptidase (prepilin peptidase) / N-methyltransferase
MNDTIRFVEEMMPWYFPAVAFVFGACIGSFLNVCIYRIPAGKSIVRPGSHCACGKPIAWYDNIPILSWFILRGKARCCGRPFSFRYPFVEILTGGLFLGCWLVAPTPCAALCWMVFMSLMVCATFIDLDTFTIPDRFSIGGLIVGVLLSILVPAMHTHGQGFLFGSFVSMIESLEGAFVGTALVYWIMVLAEVVLKRPAMGEGDVKLMGAIGAFCGWQGAMFALFGGAIIGTVAIFSWTLTQMILGKGFHLKPVEKEAAKDEPAAENKADGEAKADAGGDDEVPAGAIPFGPSLAGGAVVYLLWAQPYVASYFGQLSFLFNGR